MSTAAANSPSSAGGGADGERRTPSSRASTARLVAAINRVMVEAQERADSRAAATKNTDFEPAAVTPLPAGPHQTLAAPPQQLSAPPYELPAPPMAAVPDHYTTMRQPRQAPHNRPPHRGWKGAAPIDIHFDLGTYNFPDRPILCCFWDLESTGLCTSSDEIIQIGACCRVFRKAQPDSAAGFYDIDGLCEDVMTFSSYVQTDLQIAPHIVALTGIDNELLRKEGLPIDEALALWREWIMKMRESVVTEGKGAAAASGSFEAVSSSSASSAGSHCSTTANDDIELWLIAHNGNQFDLPLLFHTELRLRWSPGTFFKALGVTAIVDSLVLSRALKAADNQVTSHRLSDLYRAKFKTRLRHQHNALYDAMAVLAISTQEPYLSAWESRAVAWRFSDYLHAFHMCSRRGRTQGPPQVTGINQYLSDYTVHMQRRTHALEQPRFPAPPAFYVLSPPPGLPAFSSSPVYFAPQRSVEQRGTQLSLDERELGPPPGPEEPAAPTPTPPRTAATSSSSGGSRRSSLKSSSTLGAADPEPAAAASATRPAGGGGLASRLPLNLQGSFPTLEASHEFNELSRHGGGSGGGGGAGAGGKIKTAGRKKKGRVVAYACLLAGAAKAQGGGTGAGSSAPGDASNINSQGLSSSTATTATATHKQTAPPRPNKLLAI